MKFAFLVIAIFINFFNHSLIKSEEKILSSKNKIENIAKKEFYIDLKGGLLRGKGSLRVNKQP